jgi:hypothetical protein
VVTSISHSYQKKDFLDQKKVKETSKLNYILNQMNLTDSYTIFHLTVVEYTFHSAATEVSPQNNRILGHETSFNEYLKTEIITCFLLVQNGIKQAKLKII